MSLFDLSILNMFPKVVADGSEGWVHLYAEVTPESYRCFIYRAFLFTEKEWQEELVLAVWHLFWHWFMKGDV